MVHFDFSTTQVVVYFQGVLILLVMDGALRQSIASSCWKISGVLILLVMDGALRLVLML